MDWNAILLAFFSNPAACLAAMVIVVALIITNTFRRIQYIHYKTETTKRKLELDDAFRRTVEANKLKLKEAEINAVSKVKSSLDSFYDGKIAKAEHHQRT